MEAKAGAKRRQGLVLGWVGYVLLLFLLTWKHTFWRDESEVWLVARASGSLSGLLHNMRYEGHPPLWYLVQWGLTRFSSNVEWMKVPNFLCAVAAAWMVLGGRRLPLWVRLGIVFSYYMVFEYGILARNYMIGIVFLVAAARWMRESERRSRWVPVLLSLAALTSLPGLIVSMFLGLLHLWEVWRDEDGGVLRRLGGVRLAAILLFTVCALVAAAEIRPPADSSLLLESQPGPTSIANRIAKCGELVIKAYVPIPRWQPKFWNTLLLNRLTFRPEAALGLLLIPALVLLFRRPAVRCFFVAASGLEVAQMAFSGREQQRHLGWLFIIFVLSLLLDLPDKDSNWMTARRWRERLLAGILAGQVIASIVAICFSARYTFSTSKEVARFLMDHGLDRGPIAFEPFYVSQSVLAYLPQASGYNLEQHRRVDFVVWNREEYMGIRAVPAMEDLRGAASHGEAPVLITGQRLDPADAARLQVKLLAAFEDAICSFDHYYVYR